LTLISSDGLEQKEFIICSNYFNIVTEKKILGDINSTTKGLDFIGAPSKIKPTGNKGMFIYICL